MNGMRNQTLTIKMDFGIRIKIEPENALKDLNAGLPRK